MSAQGTVSRKFPPPLEEADMIWVMNLGYHHGNVHHEASQCDRNGSKSIDNY